MEGGRKKEEGGTDCVFLLLKGKHTMMKSFFFRRQKGEKRGAALCFYPLVFFTRALLRASPEIEYFSQFVTCRKGGEMIFD